MVPERKQRLPDTDPVTGLIRLNCPKCGQLIHRFSINLSGGPCEYQCPRSSCKYRFSAFFNAGPTLEELT
jgi:hypothetical protein